MELFIPGLILVAVMVWASTRIKRNAAAAFEAETIETDLFTLRKPDGWLSVVEPAGGLLFDAYTKEYAPSPNENIRLGTARVTSGENVPEGGTVRDELREVIGDVHYRVLDVVREEDGVAYADRVKVAEYNGSTFTLTIATLAEAGTDLIKGVEDMLDSFQLRQ